MMAGSCRAKVTANVRPTSYFHHHAEVNVMDENELIAMMITNKTLQH